MWYLSFIIRVIKCSYVIEQVVKKDLLTIMSSIKKRIEQ